MHFAFRALLTLPQRKMRANWEMFSDATEAIQSLKFLSDTNHFALADSHLWDIAMIVQAE